MPRTVLLSVSQPCMHSSEFVSRLVKEALFQDGEVGDGIAAVSKHPVHLGGQSAPYG